MAAALKLKVLGVAFLCLLLAGVWLTYGVFTQKFTHFDEVTLDASTIGLQMPERADVKIRGVIVGEVLGFTATDAGATVKLGIYPDQLHTIPRNVTGAIVPKTLFGEKYVSLVVPADPSPQPLAARCHDHPHRRCRSRCRRSSPTSTRCCAPCSPPTST